MNFPVLLKIYYEWIHEEEGVEKTWRHHVTFRGSLLREPREGNLLWVNYDECIWSFKVEDAVEDLSLGLIDVEATITIEEGCPDFGKQEDYAQLLKKAFTSLGWESPGNFPYS